MTEGLRVGAESAWVRNDRGVVIAASFATELDGGWADYLPEVGASVEATWWGRALDGIVDWFGR